MNQKLGGKLLSRKDGRRNLRKKSERIMPSEP
jgi:hypothetical protein